MKHYIAFGVVVCLMVILVAFMREQSITTCDPAVNTYHVSCP